MSELEKQRGANPERGSAAAPASRSSRLRTVLLAGVASAAVLASAAGVYAARSDQPHAAQTQPSVTQGVSVGTVAALPDFTELARRVKPAVVSVRVKSDVAPQVAFGEGLSPFEGNPFEGTPFDKFFKQMPSPNGRGMPQPHRFVRGQGSGFFISADGYIVTNNHVVDKAVRVEVVMDDGKVLDAKVVGTDPKSDLALLKVKGSAFPYVELAKDSPKIGEWVVAMGNPFGLGGTVTAGIVSAQGRDIGSGAYDDYIQIDAAVNRGNSGGPTFNLKGEVIGVNTAIYSPSGGSVGIAFAIPASTVEAIIPQLEKAGYVERGWLGVQIQGVNKEIADALGLKEAKGALVSQPQPGSPAAKAGIRSGDTIVGLDGSEIKDGRDLARKIAAVKPGTTVALSVVRNGETKTVSATIERHKEATARKAPMEHSDSDRLGQLGLTVAPAAQIEGAGRQGLAVLSVDPEGRAAELGLSEGDVILKAGGKAVSTPDDLEAAFAAAAAQGKGHAFLLVKRERIERYVAVPVAVG
jgi:serine protease Do